MAAAASIVTLWPASRLRAVSRVSALAARLSVLESAIIPCRSWNWLSACPNCLRSLMYSTLSLISRSATPTQTAEMCSRPRSSTCIATLKPSPSWPSRFSAGTRTLSKITSQIWAPCWPIFFSGLPTERPGRLRSTKKAETPPAPGFDGSLLAITVKRSALLALVMKRFEPFRT